MSQKKGATKTDYGVSATQFVGAWQRAKSVQEAADQLKMPNPIVLARASMYRKAGVKLKKMPRAGKSTLDIKALNQLIDDIASGNLIE